MTAVKYKQDRVTGNVTPTTQYLNFTCRITGGHCLNEKWLIFYSITVSVFLVFLQLKKVMFLN
jgi:hypothetical protein